MIEKNPVIIEAIAPFSENPFQNNDKIITGQKVAAIPDHPKYHDPKNLPIRIQIV